MGVSRFICGIVAVNSILKHSVYVGWLIGPREVSSSFRKFLNFFIPARRTFSLSMIAVLMYRCNVDVAALRFCGSLDRRCGM